MKKATVLTLVLGLVLSNAILSRSTSQARVEGTPAYVPNEVIIQFNEATAPGAEENALAGVLASVSERILTPMMKLSGDSELVVAKVPGDVMAAVRQLQSNPAVRFAEPNWIYTHDATSNDPIFTNGQLYGMYGDASNPANAFGSQAAEAWARGNVGSSNVYVGVIDEGVKFNHPDLSPNIWTNPFDPVDGRDNDGNGFVDDIRGWDFAGNNNSTYDGTGDDHGTHVSGTLGARGGNGIGVAGVSWNVRIITAKFLGASGGSTTNAIRAIDYITDLKQRHGLNIVATNNSWGGGGFSQALQNAISRAGAANILFIAAAGNSGTNNDSSPHYPSTYNNSNIIAVASITSTGAKSSFSNFGATTVDIGAPGSSINSTLPSSNNGNTYGAYSGTSMATPHVTGAAALYAASHPGASAAQIKSAILNSAVPTSSLSGRCTTGGRLNASGF
ncbi:MAG: S8 family peptidase [Acidobacteriota bacterium]